MSFPQKKRKRLDAGSTLQFSLRQDDLHERTTTASINTTSQDGRRIIRHQQQLAAPPLLPSASLPEIRDEDFPWNPIDPNASDERLPELYTDDDLSTTAEDRGAPIAPSTTDERPQQTVKQFVTLVCDLLSFSP